MLDIRLPMGCLFTALGALLVVYGLLAGADVRVLGNVDAWWGGAMTLFGVAMLALARRASKRDAGR